MESTRIVSNDTPVSDPSASSSRIPAHVFAPTSTSSQAEWSTASNESLFSIHMGNMSFNESRELDYAPVMASPLFEYPVTSATARSREDAAADETMEEKQSQQHQINVALGRSMSRLSDVSGKSFAFPILTEEEEQNDASKKVAHNKKPASSQPSTSSTTPEHTPPETPKPPETPMAEAPKSPTPKATQNGCPRRWFSCFSCFPSCS